MRHYEGVFLVHPDQSEQVKSLIEKYQGLKLVNESCSLPKGVWFYANVPYISTSCQKANMQYLHIHEINKTF